MGRPFVHQLRVRYAECDPQNVVFNSHYLAYFDCALTEMWRAALTGGYRAMMDRGLDMVVAEATCRYRTPATFDDLLEVAIGITTLGNTSMRTALAITRGDEPIVDGELRHVFIDLGRREKATIPDWLRHALDPWVLASGASPRPPAWSPRGG